MGKQVDKIQPYRNELKYIISKKEFQNIKFLLSSLNIVPQHEPNTINNIYFDTKNLDCFYENIEGLSERRKYRIRWYDHSKIMNFETKIKSGSVGRKLTEKIDYCDKIDLSKLTKNVNSILKKSNEKLLLIPTLRNRYYREYFITRPGVRLTFDSNITYTDPKNKLLSLTDNYNVIMEVKYNRKSQEKLDLLDFFNIRLQKNSKYVIGLSKINPELDLLI